MHEMTLPSGHKIRNSSIGGLTPSTLLSVTEVPHNTESSQVSGEETFVSLKPEYQSGSYTV